MLTKATLVSAVAAEAGITKKAAAKAVDAVFNNITDTVAAGEKAQFISFGTFESRERAARTCRNPRTGETLKVAAKTVPAFKPGKAFKDKVGK